MCSGSPAADSSASPTGWPAARKAGLQHAAYVLLADHLGEFDAMGREDEARLRIALPVGSGAFQEIEELVGDGGRSERAVYVERHRHACCPRGPCQALR